MVRFPEYEDVLTLSGANERKFSCVVQTARIDRPYALHHHDVLELSLVIDGFGTEIINGTPHNLQPGTVTFLRPHDMHEIICNEDNTVEVICCMFDISLLFGSSMDADFGTVILGFDEGTTSYIDLDEASYAEMKTCMRQMLSEYRADNLAKSTYIRMKIIECLIVYFRALQRSNHIAPIAAPYRTKKLIWKVIQYVNTHYIEDLSLETLSERFKTSPSAISLAFKEVLGTTFLHYLHSLRIRRATGLLLNTNMSILDVAMETGFQAFRTFSRVFVRMEGVTPREYRNREKRKTAAAVKLETRMEN